MAIYSNTLTQIQTPSVALSFFLPVSGIRTKRHALQVLDGPKVEKEMKSNEFMSAYK